MKPVAFRLIAFCVLTAVVLLGFVRCNSAQKRYRVGFSQCSYDAWHTQLTTEMRREALFYDNVALDLRIAGDDSRRQERQIDSLVREGIDLLIVSPAEAEALVPALERA